MGREHSNVELYHIESLLRYQQNVRKLSKIEINLSINVEKLIINFVDHFVEK